MAGRRRAKGVTGAAESPGSLGDVPVVAGAEFPRVELPIAPGYPPMEALATTVLPAGDQWLYEPKWDGFRCLAFRDGETVVLQSKAGQPLTRHFPAIGQAR